MRSADSLPTSAVSRTTTAPRSTSEAGRAPVIWGILRLLMGFTFLWAFLDKLLGLGFATGRDPETGQIDFFGQDAWINGGSPTDGLLQFGTSGPLAGFFQGLAGSSWVEWLFMLSMASIGVALLLGIGTKLAAWGGIAWMLSIYAATSLLPEFNPLVDEHIIYSAVLAGIAYTRAGRTLGMGNRWRKSSLVQRFPILE